MPPRRYLVLANLLVGLVIASAIVAHPDDPKGQMLRVRYEGPAYRSSLAAGLTGAKVEGDPSESLTSAAPSVEFPADGILLRSWLPLPEFGAATSGNDCWGYTAPSGNEYAMMGLSNGTGFVDITDPGNAQIITVLAGPVSSWRDIKTYQDHAYIVTEGTGAAIQVVDLSQIDLGIVTHVGTVTEDIPDGLLATTKSHNVAIDEDSGFLYRCGGGNNGLRIYSLADPANPTYVGAWSDRYVHDAQIVTYTSGAFAGQQIAYVCSGLNGGGTNTGLDVLDVTNKGAITTVAQLLYPNGRYSHQAWLSPDRQYLYLNDEADETNLGIPTETIVFDVSDPSMPSVATTFTNGITSIGHNLYTLGNLVFEANYTSGVRVFDATNPLMMSEIAYFDTWEVDDAATFNGLWNVYPYFPSGVFIGSDLEKGLFVWEFGQVELAIDIPGGAPKVLSPTGATIDVQITEINGGVLVANSPTLHLDVEGVQSDVPMTPQGGDIYRATLGDLPCFSTPTWYVSAETSGGVWMSPSTGDSDPNVSHVFESSVVGFSDDFELDQGWSVQDGPGLTDGTWDRGIPIGGGDRYDPPTDADGSGQCFLTDNVDGNSDVDGGSTMLTSPIMDATGDGVAYLVYHSWFSTNGGDDSLELELSNNNGLTWTSVETETASVGAWVRKQIRIDDHVVPTSQMVARFTASDLGSATAIEAGIDGVDIEFRSCSTKQGDTNGDNKVGIVDFLNVLGSWGECPLGCPADVDGDLVVGIQDFLLVLMNWG